MYTLRIAILLFAAAAMAGPAVFPLQDDVTRIMARHAGTALVLAAPSGEILASYHMNVAARRIAAPGSTVKPFSLMAMLENGVVKAQTSFFCPRVVRVGGRVLDCSHSPQPEAIDPVRALQYSCNHFFITAARSLSPEALYRAFSQAGLGGMTGKWRTEIPGTVTAPGSLTARQLMAIGESNVRVTPLALAEAYRQLANRLTDPESNDGGNDRLILDGLVQAVQSGTAHAAGSKMITIAGKTGTADGHAWFAGFAPARKPEVVVLVFLEKGRGGDDAAPLAGRIFDAYSQARKERQP